MRRMLETILSASMKRVSRGLNKGIVAPVNSFVSLERNERLVHRPIFIVGPPRCGSTLIYQALLSCFSFSYISNAHCLLFGAPALAERVFKKTPRHGSTDFTSEFGRTSGMLAPSECGDFWYRFFSKPAAYVDSNEVDASTLARLRADVGQMSDVSGKSVLFKNLYASLRLKPLSECFPEALFIVIERDELSNAHSILEARHRLHGDYTTWFSVPTPRKNDLLAQPAEQQVIEQIRDIRNIIKQDIQAYPHGSVIHLDYDIFCDDVHGTLGRLNKFFIDNGIHLNGESFTHMPATFNRSKEVKIDADLYERLKVYVAAPCGSHTR